MSSNKKTFKKINCDLIDGLPFKSGRWKVQINNEDPFEIEVYNHPVKGICCYAEDFGSAGTGIDDRFDCHVSVQNTGLTFIEKINGIKKRKEKNVIN